MSKECENCKGKNQKRMAQFVLLAHLADIQKKGLSKNLIKTNEINRVL